MNFLGIREPQIYGAQSLANLEQEVTEHVAKLGRQLVCFQSNSEGEIIDEIHRAYGKHGGIILNPASLSQSYSIREAIVSVGLPTVEVHMSNIYARESWHAVTVIAPVALGTICGLGIGGYKFAANALHNHLIEGGE